MPDDPIVTEVRRVRDELARQLNYDGNAICDDPMGRQGQTVTIEEVRAGAGQPTTYPTVTTEPAQVREKP